MLRGLVLAAAAGRAAAQQLGTQTQEAHPKLSVQQCTAGGGCSSMEKPVVLDSNWRWVNQVGGYENCFSGNAWNESVEGCAGANLDGAKCAESCAVEGVDAKQYESTYGVRTDGGALNLLFVTKAGNASNVGSRTYLMDDDENYMMFKLKNREFTFDVDVSQLECGLNGALYFVEMDADGGKAKYPGNKAGAKLGTGYCDAQCPHDIKWINGEANVKGWQQGGVSTGTGDYGSCCIEMDIWEANKFATAYTPHACNVTGQTRCGGDGVECGTGQHGSGRFNGVCDANGCDMQTYRMGDKAFFGPGLTVDSTKPMTVVTQFKTADGTDNSDIVEIRRLYVQDGKVIPTPAVEVGTAGSFDSISDSYCQAEVDTFKDGTTFAQRGGMKQMSDALGRGVVLVMSLWDDSAVNMLWLDGTYPPSGGPGAERGPCPASSGKPADVEANQANASVTYFNIRWGDIGSTYGGGDGPSPPSPDFPSGPPPAPSGGGLPAQCGGVPVADGADCQTDAKGPNCCPIGADGATQQGCYSKNQYWAGCKDSCDPTAVDPYDNSRWACTCLSTKCGGSGPPPAPPTPPAPTPSGGCPGGSLTACMGLCPGTPAAAYKACVQTCVQKC